MPLMTLDELEHRTLSTNLINDGMFYASADKIVPSDDRTVVLHYYNVETEETIVTKAAYIHTLTIWVSVLNDIHNQRINLTNQLDIDVTNAFWSEMILDEEWYY